MKLYRINPDTEEVEECNADKDQVKTMIKGGWSDQEPEAGEKSEFSEVDPDDDDD